MDPPPPPFKSTILRPPPRKIEQHPPSHEEDLDMHGHHASTHPQYLSTRPRSLSPAPTPSTIHIRRLALDALKARLQSLPGFAPPTHKSAEVDEYVPCEFHKRWPPSRWRSDLRALGLQAKYAEGAFHGGVRECCAWRRWRGGIPQDLLKEAERSVREEMGGEKCGEECEVVDDKVAGEKRAEDEKSADREPDDEKFEDKYNEKHDPSTNSRISERVEEEETVTYFTFITDKYFAEASWPELVDAAERRKLRPWLRKPPVRIERVVGRNVEKVYREKEIVEGMVEREEGGWWARRNGLAVGSGEVRKSDEKEEMREKGR